MPQRTKKIRVQVGDDLDVNIGFYVSPRAMAFLTALVAGGGYGGYLIQR
ncbi:hypothetical protein OG819_26955 [Streptomyces sp. NBC_01549]|nr:hypothetical protein [Streptomyces sp. NBC_01549]MCX4593260.1 hypothetical protein [Streptomyces sp. NBC_01549]